MRLPLAEMRLEVGHDPSTTRRGAQKVCARKNRVAPVGMTEKWRGKLAATEAGEALPVLAAEYGPTAWDALKCATTNLVARKKDKTHV